MSTIPNRLPHLLALLGSIASPLAATELSFTEAQAAAGKQAYESKAYQDVVGTRLAATSNHFAVLVDGLPG